MYDLKQSKLVQADFSDVELRILGHLRAVGSRDHEAERKRVEYREAIAAIVLVIIVGVWSIL